MAKISKTTYYYDSTPVEVTINCSSKGVFYCDLDEAIANSFGFNSTRVTSDTHQAIISILNKAFKEYNDSKVTRELVIQVRFGAGGTYTTDKSGYEISPFKEHRELIQHQFCDDIDKVCFCYNVYIKETRCGRSEYWKARKFTPEYKEKPENMLNGFCKVRRVAPGLAGSGVLLPYSVSVENNLAAVHRQLQSAAIFLGNLVTNKDVENILSSDKFNILPK